MRLLTYSVDGSTSFGAVNDDGVIDLAPRIDGVDDLVDLLVQDRVHEAQRLADGATSDHSLEAITYERTLRWPRKIFCIGVNYGGRNAEYRDGQAAPTNPSVFIRYPDSFTGHDHPLVRPPESEQLDYEGEIVAVIGRGGRTDPDRDRTRSHRRPHAGQRGHDPGLGPPCEVQREPRARTGSPRGAIGPWMVTLDEIAPFEQLEIRTHVNGELRQEDSPASMAFPIELQVAYLSTFTTLSPGDLIFTGTPTGAGARFDPPVWLVPGDEIEVSVEGIGTLRNGVTDEVSDHR